MRRLLAVLVISTLSLIGGCGDDDDDSASGFCDRARAVDERFRALEEKFGEASFTTPEAFGDTAEAIDDLADGAPAEIRADLQTYADAIKTLTRILGELDFTDPSVLADPDNAETLQAARDEVEEIQPEMDAASARVEAYFEDECGIEA